MNRRPATPQSRSEVWRNAAFYALVTATLLLVVIKAFTGIVFLTALLVAVAVFMIAFGFIMRMTPHDR